MHPAVRKTASAHDRHLCSEKLFRCCWGAFGDMNKNTASALGSDHNIAQKRDQGKTSSTPSFCEFSFCSLRGLRGDRSISLLFIPSPNPPPNIKYSPLWPTIIYWEDLILGGYGGLILGGGDYKAFYFLLSLWDSVLTPRKGSCCPLQHIRIVLDNFKPMTR